MGLTANGFTKKTLAQIVSELEVSFKGATSPNLNVRAPSNAATIIGIAADREAPLWDALEELYFSRSASGAQGVALENIGEYTNEKKLKASYSKIVTQYLFGTVGTTIPITTQLSVDDNPLATFKPSLPVTLEAGTNCVQHIAFSAVPDAGNWTIGIGNLTTATLAFGANAAAIQTAVRLLDGYGDVIVAGDYTAGFDITFTGLSGLQPQPLVVIGGVLTASMVAVVVTPSITVDGVAQGIAIMVATNFGSVQALAGSLTVIDTPVSGLTRTVNASDAILGRLQETDSAFRIRRKIELQNTAKTTQEAIRADLLKVKDVTQAIVFANVDDVTDMAGRPPHSVQVFVEGGTDQDVGDALWLAIGGGIQSYGLISVNVTDSQGLVQVLKINRPVLKPVFVIVNITKDPLLFPATGGVSMVEEAILAYAATLQVGDDVLLRPKLLPAIVDVVPGIVDIIIYIGYSASPTLQLNLTTAANELATFTTPNMTVNIT